MEKAKPAAAKSCEGCVLFGRERPATTTAGGVAFCEHCFEAYLDARAGR